jgi:Zn-dependent alcohol dehydrogenase
MVIALDVVEAKLEAARRFGATHAVNAGAPDAVEQVRRLTGRGADYVFVTVGAKAAIPQALAMAARSGTIVLVGMPASGVTVAVDPGDIAHNNLRVLGSKMGGAHIQADIPKLVMLYQEGRLKLDELISGIPAGEDQRRHRLGPQRRATQRDPSRRRRRCGSSA